MTFLKWSIPFLLPSLLFCSCNKKEDTVETESNQASESHVDFFTTVISNDTNTLEKLLSKGAPLSSKNEEGKTALHLSAENGYIEMVKLLLQKGAPVDELTSDGRTALFLATSNNQTETIRTLLRHNASTDLKNADGFRPITSAALNGQTEAVEALALYSRNHLDEALFLAALKGHGATIDTLTNYGASVYARLDKNGRTPLMLAAQNGHRDAARILLENGANRYSTDTEGLTASELAQNNNHSEIAEYLGITPENDDFMIVEQHDDVIEEAAMEAIEIATAEAQVQNDDPISAPNAIATGGTPAKVKTKETPLSTERLIVEPLNGRQLKTPAETPITEALSFKTYREKSLPIQIKAVDNKTVSVKYLYGEHKTLKIEAGEKIPHTNLKVISAKPKRDHSKMSTYGKPADISEVKVQDLNTGAEQTMTAGLNTASTEPFALIKEYSSGELIIAKTGDLFRKADGSEYEVLEVRSTQLILMNSETGETHTVSK